MKRSWLLVFALIVLNAEVALLLFLQLRPGRIAIVPFILGSKIFLVGSSMAIVVVAGLVILWHGFKHLADVATMLALLLLVTALVLSLVGFRTYPSSHDNKPSATCFRLPFRNDIAVLHGGTTIDENYHVGFPSQRYAYDLALVRNGKTHEGEGYVVWDYFIYGQPVLSPASGNVIAVSDGDPDQSPSNEANLPYSNAGGNHILIAINGSEFLVLGHLQPGSIRVREGESVSAGQEIAKAGNSGRSGAPHLHLHLQDSPEPNSGEGIPMDFCRYDAWYVSEDPSKARYIERGMPTGKKRSQVVRAVESDLR